MRRAVLVLVWISLTSIAVGGCRSDPPAPSCKVSGKVTVHRRPAAKAYIRYHLVVAPGQFATPSVARVDADGNYTISINAPGEYVATVFWPALTYTLPNEQGEEVEGDDRLMGRYDSPQNPALKTTVREGENSIAPIDLK